MLAAVRSRALMGVDAVMVDVEVDMAMGLPFFAVVGLPDSAVKESKVRVASAIKNCGSECPAPGVLNSGTSRRSRLKPAHEPPPMLLDPPRLSLLEPIALICRLAPFEASTRPTVAPFSVLPSRTPTARSPDAAMMRTASPLGFTVNR